MAMYHVQPCHVGARRDGILVSTEAARVRKVRADVCQALEDVPSFSIRNGYLGLKRCIRDIRHSNEGCYVGLRKIWCIASLCGSYPFISRRLTKKQNHLPAK
jgi:hypothetical protein